MIPLVAVIAALAIAALFLARRWRISAAAAAGGQGRYRAIPSPFPFYSDLVLEVTRTGGFPDMIKLHKKHGPLFWWRFLGRRVCMVGSYEAVRTVMMGEHSIVEAEYPASVKAILGPFGMVCINGKDHIRIKRLAQAAFTTKALRGYVPRMQAMAEAAVERWQKEGDILFYDESKRFAFDVAVSIIFGFDQSWTAPGLEGFARTIELFRVWLEGLFSFPIAIPGTAFARGLKARQGLMERIHASLDLLEENKAGEELEGKAGQAGKAAPAGSATPAAANGASGPAAAEGDAAGGQQEAQQGQRTALDLLMSSRDDDGGRLTRDQLADSVLTLLFAGHDTSATSLTRIASLLHSHPEAVQRLRQEQAEVVAKHGPEITVEALADMPYCEGVVREAMRITPIIAGIPRVALTDFELCGHLVPKGTRLQCSLAHPLLTDARWAGEADPLAFQPERWMGGAGLKNGAWIPFGGGPRLCLGWLLAMYEIKVLLAVMHRGFSLTLTQPDEPWLQFPLARPKHGMPARFEALAS